MAEPKSIFRRMMDRSAAVSAGDPTGGDAFGQRGQNQGEVQKDTAPAASKGKTNSGNLTTEERAKRASFAAGKR